MQWEVRGRCVRVQYGGQKENWGMQVRVEEDSRDSISCWLRREEHVRRVCMNMPDVFYDVVRTFSLTLLHGNDDKPFSSLNSILTIKRTTVQDY